MWLLVGNSSVQILQENSYLCLSDMRFSIDNITNRIKMMPMAEIVTLFAVGIVFVEYVALPVWLIVALVALFLVGTITMGGRVQRLSISLLVVAMGILLHSFRFAEDIEYNRPLDMELKVTASSVRSGDYVRSEAKVKWCEDGDLVGRKVVIWSDSLLHLSARDHIAVYGVIRPFSDKYEGYAELMHHRGFVGTMSLYTSSNFTLVPARYSSLHDWATERLRNGMTANDARAVVLAMVTGERSEITPSLRQAYSASGASHLLAVSGLHIGIVFMLVNVLLMPLVLLPYGNVIRSVLALVLIWLYVMLCGAPPSAIRAAIMFSILQLSLSSLHSYHSLNTLSATAFVMLVIDTNLLFDISFQLSFIAVAGILLWAIPIYGAIKSRFRSVNALLAIVLVGITATLATMPLVSHTFGVVSLVGILLNPIVVLLANVVVLAGVVALVVPLPIFLVVAEFVVSLQNRLVEWSQGVSWGYLSYSMSEVAVILLYLLFGVITILLWGIKLDKRTKIEL